MSRALGDRSRTRSRFGLALKFLAGFVVLTCVTTPCALGFVAYKAFFGRAEVHVYHPGGVAASLSVDGVPQARVERGFTTLLLPRGSHQIRATFDDGGERSWDLPDVTGMGRYVLATDPSVCFAQLDVTHALYSSGAIASGMGRPSQCMFDEDDVRVICGYSTFSESSGTAAYAVSELPQSVSGNRLVTLVVPVSCSQPRGSLSGALLLREALGCP